jgi:xylan 1,4-beta-xylosidase
MPTLRNPVLPGFNPDPTGAFVGVAASDLNGTALHANFDEFIYRPQHDASDRYEI